MPTGNTSDIYEGKDVTLRDFIMTVGRGMGYAIMQRDDSYRDPVKHRVGHYEERIKACRDKIGTLEATTVEEAEALAIEDYNAKVASRHETLTKNQELRARYVDMLRQVEAWKPDPLIESTKQYAIEQLTQSLEFDCGVEGQELKYYPDPKLLSGEEWLAEEKKRANDALLSAIKYNKEEIERCADTNKHVDALYASLPDD